LKTCIRKKIIVTINLAIEQMKIGEYTEAAQKTTPLIPRLRGTFLPHGGMEKT
jgi:hypothetical protein